MKKRWLQFCQFFTVCILAWITLTALGIPIEESNGTTLLHSGPMSQRTAAKALSLAIGEPLSVLNTRSIWRFIFRDGTSMDFLTGYDQSDTPYPVVALKQVVLPIWSPRKPIDVAHEMQTVLLDQGFESRVVAQPDEAFASGDIVILFSDAFRSGHGAGYAILIRKNALRLAGPEPKTFHGW